MTRPGPTADPTTADLGAAHLGAADPNAAESGAADLGAATPTAADRSAVDLGAAKSGATDLGAVESGAADLGAVESGAADSNAVDLGGAVLRRAVASDVPALVELVYDLAEYEKAGHECTVTAEQLRAALFGPEPKVFAHVVADGPDLLGCAIWFLNFSTWDGVHGIYLEDLYVKPETRGKGYGKALLAALAKEAVDHGYSRVAWSVLTWNRPSIEFYESIGAVVQDEWAGYRLAGDALGKLAAEAR